MLRIARTRGGITVDRQQRLPGRGAYVHRDLDCARKAVEKGGLARTLRCPVTPAFFEVLKDEGLS